MFSLNGELNLKATNVNGGGQEIINTENILLQVTDEEEGITEDEEQTENKESEATDEENSEAKINEKKVKTNTF